MGLIFDVTVRGVDRLGMRMAHASREARHAVAVQAAKDTEPYVPARAKNLANRSGPRLTDATKVEDDTIIYPGPYAHYLYIGKLFIDPDTGSSWAPAGAHKVITGTDLDIKKSVHSKAQDHWFEASKAQNVEKWIRVAGRAMQHEF